MIPGVGPLGLKLVSSVPCAVNLTTSRCRLFSASVCVAAITVRPCESTAAD
jgi:hypothetical protein